MSFFSKPSKKTKPSDIDIQTNRTASNPWTQDTRSLRNYNETITKLILSRNTPVVRSPTHSSTLSTQNDAQKLPKITLFDGFTNAAIAARYKTLTPLKNVARIASLVYCSAGMIGGQLSSAGGTHFAQEEGTLVENPLTLLAVDQALVHRYGDSLRAVQEGPKRENENTKNSTSFSIERTEYPLYRFDEITKELNANDTAFTTSYGFLIDNVIPLSLDDNKLPKSTGSYEFFNTDATKNPEQFISYIMQAAIHLGLTNEDEVTNYMFATNLHNILSTPQFLTSSEVDINGSNLSQPQRNPKDRQKIISDFHFLRSTAQNASNFYQINLTPQVPAPEQLTSSNDAFHAFSTSLSSRTGLRYAMKVLLFSDFEYRKRLQNQGFFEKDLALAIYKDYNDNYTKIEANYENALRTQIVNQLALTKQHNKNVLITGAYGCGVYNNDWAQVARVYGAALRQHGSHLDEVIICNKLEDGNRQGMVKFCQVLTDSLHQAKE